MRSDAPRDDRGSGRIGGDPRAPSSGEGDRRWRAGPGPKDRSEEPEPAEGWLVLPPGRLPPKWRRRAIPMAVVPLSPEEAADLIDEADVPRIDPVDEGVARLAARGLTVTAMARELNLSARSVNRRLARLREHFGVGSTAELAVELARRGF